MYPVLIFPPQWNPFQPYLSLPSLLAYLKRHGKMATLVDANIQFYHYLFSHRFQTHALKRASGLLAGDLPETARAELLAASAVIGHFEEYAVDVDALRRGETYGELSLLKVALSSWEIYLSAVSTIYSPIKLTTHSLEIPELGLDLIRIRRFCDDPEQNPFWLFYCDELLSLVTGKETKLIGISVVGLAQVYPALTLCRLVRKAIPAAHITVGGSVFSRVLETGKNHDFLFAEFVDSVVLFEGEEPLLKLVRAIRHETSLSEVPNLAYVGPGGSVQRTALMRGPAMSDLPTPDFAGLDLCLYFTPVPVLPLLSSRGCYWGKCAFCHHGMIYGGGARFREAELVASDLEALSREHGTPFFTLNDEAVPPRLFARLADHVLPHQYAMSGLIRFEKAYDEDLVQKMDHVGIRCVYVGLESASERLLAHMKKSTLRETMHRFLSLADATEIWSHMFAFFGFPTETHEEAQETMDFLLQTPQVHSFGVSTFSLEHNAPVYHEPAKFGITRLGREKQAFFDLYYDYDAESGLTASVASEWVEKLMAAEKLSERPGMSVVSWVPRELLLVLLGLHGKTGVLEKVAGFRAWLSSEPLESLVASRYRAMRIPEVCVQANGNAIPECMESGYLALDSRSGQVCQINHSAFVLLREYGQKVTVAQLAQVPEFAPLVKRLE